MLKLTAELRTVKAVEMDGKKKHKCVLEFWTPETNTQPSEPVLLRANLDGLKEEPKPGQKMSWYVRPWTKRDSGDVNYQLVQFIGVEK